MGHASSMATVANRSKGAPQGNRSSNSSKAKSAMLSAADNNDGNRREAVMPDYIFDLPDEFLASMLPCVPAVAPDRRLELPPSRWSLPMGKMGEKETRRYGSGGTV